MKDIARRLIAIAALAASLSASAQACSCLALSPEEQVEQTELIFIGIAQQTVRSDEEGSDTVYTVFKVKETLKGEPSGEIYVFHPENLGGNCGVDFEDGKEALVLAHDEEGEAPPTTNLCAMAGVSEPELRAALRKAGK